MEPTDPSKLLGRLLSERGNRESTIVLDDNGRFFHDGQPISHPRLQRALARWLDRHPDNQRFILNNGHDWCYLTVRDTPFFVTRIQVSPTRVTLTLSDETTEPLDAESLTVGGDDVLRVLVKQGQFEARFSRHAQLQIAPLLVTDAPPTIAVGKKRYPIVPHRNSR